ncbi:MAG: FAD-binding oxidoreductase [Rhodospirillales bacterium]|nr:FAD-binding oxidoreductase [Rhodospirillales bacterium]
MPPLSDTLIEKFKAVVGISGVITAPADQEPFVEEERGLYRGVCDAVILPATTEQVSQVVTICSENNLPITPQGGNTGLCGGAVAHGGIILSLKRMNKILNIDPLNQTMTVESGVILASIQAAAEDTGFLFPLSLGAEGSCLIGGNLATNAGGVNVLRYGNSRELVLGLEVVLADGRIWNGLRGLRKDNTGYDLKHLFMGSEGTLGIITKAVLKLFPYPKTKETALLALPGLDEAAQIFSASKENMGDSLSAFELISHTALSLTTKHISGIKAPFENVHAQYVLIEFTSPQEGSNLRDSVEAFLGGIFEQGLAEDGVIAESQSQALDLWRLRESIPEAQKIEGGSIKHDVSVPVSSIIDFLTKATNLVEAEMPGIRVCSFGHFGDGNIHFNLTQPKDMDRHAFMDQWNHFNRLIHDLVNSMGGSFSAEHGIGQLKVGELEKYKDPVELELMKTIKKSLDPMMILNPGKIIRNIQ